MIYGAMFIPAMDSTQSSRH